LTPLDALRRRIADIRNGKSSTVPSDAPEEIRPLVEELNALLLAKEQEIGRSRGRAADLAHGLKTPLAALASDVERLKLAGQTDIARNIEQVGDIMNRHVDRELARARARGGAHTSAAMVTALAPLLETLIQTVSRTRDGGRIAFEVLTEPSIVIRMDRTDLAEVLGNLIENAARHARSVVKVSSHELIEGTSVVIEDDGAGIETEKLDMLSKRGVRLDERGGGAGLGLAIVQDVLDTYGWRLDLGRSALGGLRAAIAPSPGSRAGDQFGSAAHAGA
jgi:signal transduction histidine kinase